MNNILVKQLSVRQTNKLVQRVHVFGGRSHLQGEKLSGPVGWQICDSHTWVTLLHPEQTSLINPSTAANEQHSEPAVEDL